jgi:hypothetical protein
VSALTPEQQAVVDAPMMPLCVIACAGSGKTKTAVHRLVKMRRNLGNARGRVALLSFSNVAVDTFRKAYDNAASCLPVGTSWSRVDIDTLDGFITKNIMRPHGLRTMGSALPAFLVTGNEAFLEGFKFSTSSFPQPITSLNFGLVQGDEVFFHVYNDQIEFVDTSTVRNLVERLGRTGAYTHDLGRYWVHRVLKERPALLAAAACRYPHIMIDEAQDIGSVHQAILEMLISAGSCVSLIGDPNQGIYGFSGANGDFLRRYQQRVEVKQHFLRRNFRSAPSIVALGNSLCGHSDTAERPVPSTPHGAFFTGYKVGQHSQLITAFRGAMCAVGADAMRSSVLCRSKGLANTLRGEEAPAGQGLVKMLAAAAVERDKNRDFMKAFQHVAVAVVALLDRPPHGLVNQITQHSFDPQNRALRKEIWSFTRDGINGLPFSSLVADKDWQPLLLTRIKLLLDRLEKSFRLKTADNIGRKLSKKGLPSVPLSSVKESYNSDAIALRVDTVHKSKGESLDAVLYITLKGHAQALLAGVDTEVGRIGYVAATRARDLLWIAVPDGSLEELRPALLAKGLMEVRIPAAGATIVPKAK